VHISVVLGDSSACVGHLDRNQFTLNLCEYLFLDSKLKLQFCGLSHFGSSCGYVHL